MPYSLALKRRVDENEKNKEIDAFQVHRSLNQVCFSDRTIEALEAGIMLNDKSKIESHICEIAMSQRDSEKPVMDFLEILDEPKFDGRLGIEAGELVRFVVWNKKEARKKLASCMFATMKSDARKQAVDVLQQIKDFNKSTKMLDNNLAKRSWRTK